MENYILPLFLKNGTAHTLEPKSKILFFIAQNKFDRDPIFRANCNNLITKKKKLRKKNVRDALTGLLSYNKTKLFRGIVVPH